MSEVAKPLRIFVAMPGELGPKSRYESAASVKAQFLDRIKEEAERKLRCPVQLVIEKEKQTTGPIHASMFKEAVEAEVYIADLTNANPNVYLELGVRWALRDGLTIPIYQNPEDLRFNVGGTRAFQYKPDNIRQQVTALTDLIAAYRSEPYGDSPVRNGMELMAVPRAELEALKEEIRRLQASRGEDLFRAAETQSKPDDKIALLEQATAGNPAFTEAWIRLGVLYRELSAYEKSEEALLRARNLEPGRAVIHRELGVTYSKSGQAQKAIPSYREAVGLDPNDPETWSNLGGALRRMGMRGALGAFDQAQLEEARASYKRASDLANYDLYAALNMYRLDLVLSRWDPKRLAEAVRGFETMLPLCQFQVNKNPDDYWRRFDLAEAVLFSSHREDALRAYQKALDTVPPEKRMDTLRSVREPLGGYLAAGILPPELQQSVEEVLKVLPGTN